MVPLLTAAAALLVLLLLAFAAIAVLGPGETLEQRGEKKYSRLCSVKVYNGYFKDSKIASSDCRTGDRCYFDFPSVPLGLFSDDLRVGFTVGDASTLTPLFNLDEGKTYTQEVKVCSSLTVGKLTLYDEKGQQLGDRRTVNFG